MKVQPLHAEQIKDYWGTLVPRLNVENGINWDFYWNKCILYIRSKLY
jgi:hypothetical protein